MASVDIRFSVTAVTRPGEILCMVGNHPLIGNWDPQKGKVLRLEKSLENNVELWAVTLRLAPSAMLEYRYVIAHVHESEGDGEDHSIMVRYWETNLKPRAFSCQEFFTDEERYSPENSQFGNYGGKKTIDKGWLTTQTEIHMRLYGNPIHMWKSAHRRQSYRVKCTTLDLRHREMSIDYDEEESNHDLATAGAETHPYVSILDGEHEDSVLQSQFGPLYQENDYTIYKIQTHDPEYLGYKFDFYVADPRLGDEEEAPKYVGYSYLLPVKLRKSTGRKQIPINGLKHKPIGQLTVDWLVIKPLKGHQCDMTRSFHKYWKARQSLDVGHRGMGSSYNRPKECEAVRENTIQSLSEAGRHGADLVEFDVQLSKDKVPVVYHDFNVSLTLRKRSDELDWFEIPVRDLNLSQLQMLKVDHVSIKSKGSPLNVPSCSADEDSADTRLFPPLRDVFQHVDSHLGFLVELKYPVEMKNGSCEEGVANYFDKNEYCDAICRETLQYAGDRRVIFLSFEPDICTMMRLKQNLYPVTMLTQGKTQRYDWYLDERTWSTRMAYSVARSERFLAVGVHSEEILQDRALISLAKQKGLVLLGWGEEFDNHDNVKLCKQLGMEGIIYDKVGEFTAGKENVFKIEKQMREGIYMQFDPRKTTSLTTTPAPFTTSSLPPSPQTTDSPGSSIAGSDVIDGNTQEVVSNGRDKNVLKKNGAWGHKTGVIYPSDGEVHLTPASEGHLTVTTTVTSQNADTTVGSGVEVEPAAVNGGSTPNGHQDLNRMGNGSS